MNNGRKSICRALSCHLIIIDIGVKVCLNQRMDSPVMAKFEVISLKGGFEGQNEN